MILLSVILYIVIAAWYLLGSDESQRISSIVGTCLSSFLAFWYWGENDVAMIIYIVMGLVCVFFHWISIDAKKAAQAAKSKNKTIAALLALFLGGWGVHRFYLRKSTSGLLYVLFSWSSIFWIVGIIEAIRFFAMKQTRFDELYNRIIPLPQVEKDSKPTKQTESSNRDYSHTEPVDEEFTPPIGTNERDGDNLNYRNICVSGYKAEAIGSVEDFSIVINTKRSTYTFKAKNGDICSCRSSSMRGTKQYEVI